LNLDFLTVKEVVFYYSSHMLGICIPQGGDTRLICVEFFNFQSKLLYWKQGFKTNFKLCDLEDETGPPRRN
jgi:hypothetical protein